LHLLKPGIGIVVHIHERYIMQRDGIQLGLGPWWHVRQRLSARHDFIKKVDYKIFG
jgi:hypothetical protein